MKCEIIRDLLPMYLDGLTSEESNQEVKAHLNECEPCKKMLEQMKQETTMKVEEIKEKKRKINPFRKINRRMKGAVAATVAICICLGGAGWKVFVQGFAVEPDDITMNVQVAEGNLYLDFELQEDAVLEAEVLYDQASSEISLRRAYQMPFDDRGKYPNRFSWGMALGSFTADIDEKAEVTAADDNLESAEKVTVTIVGTSPTMIRDAVMMPQEDGSSNITIGEISEEVLQEYTVRIDYGNKMEKYALLELLEMAK